MGRAVLDPEEGRHGGAALAVLLLGAAVWKPQTRTGRRRPAPADRVKTFLLHVYIIILTILCRLKISELKKRQIGDIRFINTNLMDEWNIKHDTKETEANLLRSLLRNQKKDTIHFPYEFK